jgi:tetratricopeptide (TPR) repeat protein
MPQTDSKNNPIAINARRLEQRVATARLMKHAFPGFQEGAATAGRYAIFDEAVAASPQLRETLLSPRDANIGREWQRLRTERQSNVRFLHALAVLYREQACWAVSAPLWAALFSSRDFWDYFGNSRFTDRTTGERRALTEDERGTIFNQTLGAILSLHRIQGSREFAAGRYDTARVHLNCLDVCRSGGENLVKVLEGQGQPWGLKLDPDLSGRVTKLAAELLDNWCAALVHEAEKETENPEAIKDLPQGIRKNYEGGIDRLAPFINLNIGVVRVLHNSLLWYNDWCYDLYVKRELQPIRELLQPACKVADKLIPLCIQGRDFEPANQALSQHFLLRGFASDGPPERAMEAYKEALRWNAANTNARQLLGGVVREVLMERLDTAVKCSERKQFREAHEVLDSLDKEIASREKAVRESSEGVADNSIGEDKDTLRKVRAVVHFNNANHFAEDGSFRSALEFAAKALQFDPEHPVLNKFHAEMKELAPEEDNLRYLKAASEALDKENFSQAIAAAEKVRAQSKFYARGRAICAGAHFRRGINSANDGKLPAAEADLQAALSFADGAEERTIIQKQLDVCRKANIGKQVSDAVDKNDWEGAQKVLRNALQAPLNREEGEHLRGQLSALLNAQAVTMINEVQETEKQFGEAIGDIISTVKSMQGVQ